MTRPAHRRILAQTWLRVGAVRVLVPLMVALGTVACLLPRLVITPQLRAVEPTDVPTTLALGTAAGIAAAYSAVEPEATIWQLAPVGRRWHGQLRVLTLLTTLNVIVAAGAPASLPSMFTASATTTGEALLIAATIDHRVSWALPAAHAAIAALLGAHDFGNLNWWAWIANPTPTTRDLTLSALVLLTGVVTHRQLGSADRL